MSGRLVHELEYHYSDCAFGDGPDANITIRYYRKMDRFAKYKLANNSNFTVCQITMVDQNFLRSSNMNNLVLDFGQSITINWKSEQSTCLNNVKFLNIGV